MSQKINPLFASSSRVRIEQLLVELDVLNAKRAWVLNSLGAHEKIVRQHNRAERLKNFKRRLLGRFV